MEPAEKGMQLLNACSLRADAKKKSHKVPDRLYALHVLDAEAAMHATSPTLAGDVLLPAATGAAAAALTDPAPSMSPPLDGQAVWPLCCCDAPLQRHEIEARVFGVAQIQHVTIVEATCTQCKQRSSWDGAEHLILRKGPFSSEALGSFELCFSWELLDDMFSGIASGGMFFWAKWKDQMRKWDNVSMTEPQLQALHSIYRHFSAAWMDFVVLQNLPYDDVHKCQCAVPHKHLLGDGLGLSLKCSEARMAGPWLPQQLADGTPPLAARYGSDFSLRFAIADADLRSKLRPITTASEDGWADQELAALLETCAHLLGPGAPDVDHHLRPIARALQTIFSAEHLPVIARTDNRLREHVRKFLREISASSPACQLVYLGDLELLQRLTQSARAALAADDAAAAAEASRAFDEDARQAFMSSSPCIAPCAIMVHLWAAQQEHASLCYALLTLFDFVAEVCDCFNLLDCARLLVWPGIYVDVLSSACTCDRSWRWEAPPLCHALLSSLGLNAVTH